jgi:hypothetical protein
MRALWAKKNRDSSVGIATKLRASRPRSPCSITCRGKMFLSSPQRPDRPWALPSLLSNGYRGFIHGAKAAEA